MSRHGGANREEERLREFFRAVHADDRPPSFERLARPRPEPAPVAAAGRWRPAVAVLAVVAIAVAAAWWLPRLGAPGAAALSEEQQLALAHELSSWRGPLDFLLETPGREVLSSPPRLALSTFTIPPPAEPEENQP